MVKKTERTVLAVQTARKESCSRSFKVFACFTVLLCVCTASLFAASESISTLDTFGDKIYGLLHSKTIKVVMGVAFMASFGGIAFGKATGNGGIVNMLIPIIFAVGGILSIGAILNFFWDGVDDESLTMLVDTARVMLA